MKNFTLPGKGRLMGGLPLLRLPALLPLARRPLPPPRRFVLDEVVVYGPGLGVMGGYDPHPGRPG